MHTNKLTTTWSSRNISPSKSLLLSSPNQTSKNNLLINKTNPYKL